ncbi:MAG TPA: phytanoyl-CoA dioxygenase family protein [Acidimicrobiales bacterium]|nr:phytanoyl-CoA dioxygenase family protein [Acidimicrobiales bacterium]
MGVVDRLRRLVGGAPASDDGSAPVARFELTEEQRACWRDQGFVMLPRLFDAERLRVVNDEIERFWDERTTNDRDLVIDVFIDTPDERRLHFRDAPEEARRLPYKLNDTYLASVVVREMVLDLRLAQVVDELLDGAPMVCNSLNFERGSQQRFHFDTFYMPPVVPNKMCASWIALEDCEPAAGPLRYYPGSHQLAPYRFSDGRLNARVDEMDDFDEYIEKQIADAGLDWTSFPARAGDVFIWHAQLYHGGSPIDDMSRTRKSLVTHYFRAQDGDPGPLQDMGQGRWWLLRSHQPVP